MQKISVNDCVPHGALFNCQDTKKGIIISDRTQLTCNYIRFDYNNSFYAITISYISAFVNSFFEKSFCRKIFCVLTYLVLTFNLIHLECCGTRINFILTIFTIRCII